MSGPHVVVGRAVPAATPGSTVPPPKVVRPPFAQQRVGQRLTVKPGSPSSDGTESEQADPARTSSKPVVPSSGSNEPWRTPTNIREFAAMTNAIATAVINGEVRDLEPVKLYAALARTVAQAMSTEVQRARFLGTAPDLTFSNDDRERPQAQPAGDQ